MPASPRHFIDLWRFDQRTLRAILDDAHARKAARIGWPKGRVDPDAPARDRTLAMIFEKNSTRTRFSFDAAIRQLGGDSIIATANDMQLGRGETIEDTARVLSRMVDAVMIRANGHADVEALARDEKLLIAGGGDNCVRLLPSLLLTRAEAREAVEKLERACEAARAKAAA